MTAAVATRASAATRASSRGSLCADRRRRRSSAAISGGRCSVSRIQAVPPPFASARSKPRVANVAQHALAPRLTGFGGRTCAASRSHDLARSDGRRVPVRGTWPYGHTRAGPPTRVLAISNVTCVAAHGSAACRHICAAFVCIRAAIRPSAPAVVRNSIASVVDRADGAAPPRNRRLPPGATAPRLRSARSRRAVSRV